MLMLFDAGQRLSLDKAPVRLRRVTVEVTTWCNLDCPGCQRTQGLAAGTWRNRHMSVETFAGVVDHLPPCDLLVMHGIGEPTMHPDYLELIDIAKASGKFARLHCNTNAMARNFEFYFEMVERGLDSFSVSVDSLRPDIVQQTRAGTDVDRLVTRLKMFHRLNLPFSIQMVVSRVNYDDIFFTLHALNGIGPCTVFIQPFIDYDGAGKALSREMAVLFMARLRNLSRQFGNLTIHAGGFRSLGIEEGASGLPMCTSPWLDPGIDVDGFLTPCCVHLQGDTLGRCNLAEMSYDDAWHSMSVQRFLAAYVESPPDFCAGCSENVRSVKPGPAVPAGEPGREALSVVQVQAVAVCHERPTDLPPPRLEQALESAREQVRQGDVEHGFERIRALLADRSTGARHVGDAIVDAALVADGQFEELLERYRQAVYEGLWPPPALRAERDAARARGVPPVFICTLPKSGSLFISEMLQTSLGCPTTRLSLDLFPKDYLIPEMVSFLASGGISSWGHVDASPRNLDILRQCGLTRFVLHLRDPRQVVVSFINHIDHNLRGANLFYRWRFSPRLPAWYDQADMQRKVDWYLDERFASEIAWIRDWLSVLDSDPDFDLLLTRFEDFRGNEPAYLARIYDFFLIPESQRVFSIPDKQTHFHFRAGEVAEWRRVCSPRQQERMWDMLGEELATRMGWGLD